MDLTTVIMPFNGTFPSTRPDPGNAVDSSESDTCGGYSLTVQDSLTESDPDESDVFVPFVRVDSNSVLTNETSATIDEAFSRRDYSHGPLQHHKCVLLQSLIVDGNIIHSSATQVNWCALWHKEDGTTPHGNELGYLVQLSYKAFESTPGDKLSFSRVGKMQIICIPDQRDTHTSVF